MKHGRDIHRQQKENNISRVVLKTTAVNPNQTIDTYILSGIPVSEGMAEREFYGEEIEEILEPEGNVGLAPHEESLEEEHLSRYNGNGTMTTMANLLQRITLAEKNTWRVLVTQMRWVRRRSMIIVPTRITCGR